jgi:hypothetical protein
MAIQENFRKDSGKRAKLLKKRFFLVCCVPGGPLAVQTATGDRSRYCAGRYRH